MVEERRFISGKFAEFLSALHARRARTHTHTLHDTKRHPGVGRRTRERKRKETTSMGTNGFRRGRGVLRQKRGSKGLVTHFCRASFCLSSFLFPSECSIVVVRWKTKKWESGVSHIPPARGMGRGFATY